MADEQFPGWHGTTIIGVRKDHFLVVRGRTEEVARQRVLVVELIVVLLGALENFHRRNGVGVLIVEAVTHFKGENV